MHDIDEVIAEAATRSGLRGAHYIYGEYPKCRWVWIYDGDQEWLQMAIREDPESLDNLVELSRYSAVLVTLHSMEEGVLGLLVGGQIMGRPGPIGTIRTFTNVEDIDRLWLIEALSIAEKLIEEHLDNPPDNPPDNPG